MEIFVDENNRIVKFWLTKDEQENERNQSRFKQIAESYTADNFRVAVFHSGKADLLSCTDRLLKNNLCG